MRYRVLFILIGFLVSGELMAKDDLKTYRVRRNVKASGEPAGKKEKSHKQPIFVIQKHDASHLHYDFRLEMGGVLKSWAVPKGPSLNPKEKRLAAPTDDHPMSYADFEGIIPEGNYGAGTVMVWDYGTYDNIKADKPIPETMEQSYDDGKIEVFLHGEKLQGAYALVRMSNRDQWLLIKMKDDYADARRNLVSRQTESAKTGRSMAEIRGEGDDVKKKAAKPKKKIKK
jgi:DNA ligase D-like protein (predicted 3'-phosphoesterase)